MAQIFRFLLWAAQFPSQTQTKKLAKFCAQVLVLCRATAARDTRTNLALCFPELNPRQLDQWVHESLVNLCLLFFEFAQFAFWPKEKLLGQITTVEGKERLDAAVDGGAGVVLLVPHFGNWEILSVYLSDHYDLAALYDPPKIKALDAPVLQARRRFGSNLFPINTSGIRSLFKSLKQGHIVAILPDQVPARSAGINVDFFGNSALTMTLAHRLVSQSPRPVLFASVQRRFVSDGYTYKLCIEAAPPDLVSRDTDSSARAMNRCLESIIRRAPVQYQWAYKRFKRAEPLGEKNVYRRQ